MRKSTIPAKVLFKRDRREGTRLAVIITNDKETKNILLKSLPLVYDSPLKVEVRNTTGYIIKHKLISFAKRTAYIFKAIKHACSNDFNRHQYAE